MLKKLGLTLSCAAAGIFLLASVSHAAPPPFQAVVDAINASSAAITAAISASSNAIVTAIQSSNSKPGAGTWPPDPTDLVDLDSRQNGPDSSFPNLALTNGVSSSLYNVPANLWLVITDVSFDANLYGAGNGTEGGNGPLNMGCSLDQVLSGADTKKIALERAHSNPLPESSAGISPTGGNYRTFHIASSVGVAFAPGSSVALSCYSTGTSGSIAPLTGAVGFYYHIVGYLRASSRK